MAPAPRRRVAFASLAALVAALLAAWLEFGVLRGGRGARTIVLVTVDTLRRDRVGAYGAKTVTTPRMDSIAAEGVRFDDARTPVPLTLPAHTTMLTGLSPAAHGVRVNGASRLPPRGARNFPLLAERMSERGRRCGAFVSAGPLAAWFGLSQGFEVYDDEGLDEFGGLSFVERPGRDTVARALAWVRSLPGDAPAFLWVHLFEPHAPHEAGGAAGYDVDVALADQAVGMLLDGLEGAGRGDAAVCLASDHGEALGELGEETHGWLLGESVLRVPLLLRVPGGPRGAVRRDPVDLADVAPTLLSLAGEDEEPGDGDPSRGIDLLSRTAPPDRVRVAESVYAWQQFRWAQLTAAVGSGWKLEDRGLDRERIFRLADDAPPYQDGGAVAAGRSEAAPLAAALRRYRQVAMPGRAVHEGAAPGGYAGGGPVGPLLDPKENAGLFDPYEVISDASTLFTIHALVGARDADALLRQLAPVMKRDVKNPFAAFLRGLILTGAGRAKEAADWLRKTLDRGRLEPTTLLYATDAAATAGGPAAGLEVLDAYAGRMAPDTRVCLLEARLAQRTGDLERVKDACLRARDAAKNRRDRERVDSEPGCK